MKFRCKSFSASVIAIVAATAIAVITVTGCSKEGIVDTPNNSQSSEKVSASSEGLIPLLNISFSWYWHRKKYNCMRGWGICGFTIDIKPGSKGENCNATDIYQTSDGNYIVFLEAPQDAPFDDESKRLYVDEDITETGLDGNYLTIAAEAYQFDETIGNHGGYEIPLIKE